MPNALVIDGHPNPESLSAALAQSYASAHGDAAVLALRDLDFDPHMRFGYRRRIPIEPDLQAARDALHEARRIVIVAPMWWGGVPALLKGFFDRALLPGDEYRMSKLGMPIGLLAGRSGRFFMLADTPAIALPFTGNSAAGQVARHTMRFVGLRPFRVHRFLGVGAASEARIARWFERAAALGAADGARDGACASRVSGAGSGVGHVAGAGSGPGSGPGAGASGSGALDSSSGTLAPSSGARAPRSGALTSSLSTLDPSSGTDALPVSGGGARTSESRPERSADSTLSEVV